MQTASGPLPYFIDADGKSHLITEDNWKFKGSPHHALIEWNFLGCRKTLMLPQRKHENGSFVPQTNSGEIAFYGPNEKLIHIRCDSIYKNGYLLYNSLDDVMDDLDLINRPDLVLKVLQVQEDLDGGVYNEQLRKMEEDYQKEKIAYQGVAGPSSIKSESGWISDETPKDYQQVLVLLENGEIFKAMYCDDVEAQYHSEYFKLNKGIEITHWMPLPELP